MTTATEPELHFAVDVLDTDYLLIHFFITKVVRWTQVTEVEVDQQLD